MPTIKAKLNLGRKSKKNWDYSNYQMKEEEVQQFQIGNYTFKLLKRPDGTYKSEPLPQLEGVPIPLVPSNRRILGVFESSSHPGEKHYVILSPSGEIYCTCFGFRSPNKCWHYRGMVEAIKEGHLDIDKLKEPIIIKMEENNG